METTIKYFSKKFLSEESEDKAYIKLCRWTQQHIVNDGILKETYIHIIPLHDEELHAYRLDLHAPLPAEESREKFCNSCKEFHKRFYINQQYNCDRCNMRARVDDIHQRLLVKKEYRKEILKQKIKR